MSDINDMGFIQKENYTPLNMGNYDAIIHGVIGLGLHDVLFQGQKKDPAIFIKIIYEIPSELRSDEKTQVVGQKIKLSTHEKSKYFQLLQAIYSTDFNKENILSYVSSSGLKQLLGKTVSLSIAYFEKDGREISYVDKVVRLDPRLPQPKLSRTSFFFNPLNPDLDIFEHLITLTTQEQIMSALNKNTFPSELHALWENIKNKNISTSQKTKTISPPFNTESIE